MSREAVKDLVLALREQTERLEAVLALAEAQTGAIVDRDLDGVSGLTQRIERELAAGRGVEERRSSFAARLADAVGAPQEDALTLSSLARLLPAGEARDLLRAGTALRAVTDRLQAQSQANRSLIEHELAVIDQVMRVAHRGEHTTYRPSGAYARDTVALLDARA